MSGGQIRGPISGRFGFQISGKQAPVNSFRLEEGETDVPPPPLADLAWPRAQGNGEGVAGCHPDDHA